MSSTRLPSAFVAAALALACIPCANAAKTAVIGVSFTIDSSCSISKGPLAAKPEMPGVACLHDEPVAVTKGSVASNFTPEAIEENSSHSAEGTSEAGEPIWIVSF